MAKEKNFCIDLTPQNDEWVKMVPNPSKNIDYIINKLFERASEDGLLLEVIGGTLTVADLQKFKASYKKMIDKREQCLSELSIGKRVIETQEDDIEDDFNNDVQNTPIVTKGPIKKLQKKTQSEVKSHGFDEDTF